METVKKIFVTIIIASFVPSCQQPFDLTQYIRLRMEGTLIAPEGASGAYEPIFQDYLFEALYFQGDDDELYTIFEDEAEVFRIIDRPQILLESEMLDELRERSYKGLIVKFYPLVLGASRYEDEHTITLESGDVLYENEFSLEKGRGLSIDIKVNWKNTVIRDESETPPLETMQTPDFTISVKSEASP
jgi:hypothetical protein